MHYSAFQSLPEKKLSSIFKLIGQIFWFNFFLPKISRIQSRTKSVNPTIQKLHLSAHRIQGELHLLESDLNSLAYIKGSISERKVKDATDPSKIHSYPQLRWYEGGNRKFKHIVKVKKKEGDLTLEEAKILVNNSSKADSLKKSIKERKYKLSLIEAKLSVLTGRPTQINNLPFQEVAIQELIGRNEELALLQNNLLHNISTLVIGEPGIGKSFLAKSLVGSQERPCIWIDNLKAARNVLVEQVVLKLHSDKTLKLDDEDYSDSLSFEELKTKHLKSKSIAQLAESISDSIIIASSKNIHYIIIIDSMAGLTQANQIIIEKLTGTGAPIIALSNRLKIGVEFESLYRRFTKLELNPLSTESINHILENRIQNMETSKDNQLMLKTKIQNACVGNPGIAHKMLQDAQALSLSGGLREEQIRSIQEPELTRKYFDLTPLFIVGITFFAVLRFIGIGTNDTLLYVIGGIAFVILMAFSRVMMRSWNT